MLNYRDDLLVEKSLYIYNLAISKTRRSLRNNRISYKLIVLQHFSALASYFMMGGRKGFSFFSITNR